jgi:Tfp pilus assembly protein PilF
MRLGRALSLSAAGLAVGLALAGCTTSNSFSSLLKSDTSAADASASAPPAPASEPETTGSVALGGPAPPGLLGSNPADDLSLGKKYYRAGDFGLAEKYFRRAVELHSRDGEAWLDLAAAYDRLRRFDLADRAYAQAIAIVGPTAEILNNQGYSYMLRGDYKRARATLATAQSKDPANRYVQNNLQLLKDSTRTGKAIE